MSPTFHARNRCVKTAWDLNYKKMGFTIRLTFTRHLNTESHSQPNDDELFSLRTVLGGDKNDLVWRMLIWLCAAVMTLYEPPPRLRFTIYHYYFVPSSLFRLLAVTDDVRLCCPGICSRWVDAAPARTWGPENLYGRHPGLFMKNNLPLWRGWDGNIRGVKINALTKLINLRI